MLPAFRRTTQLSSGYTSLCAFVCVCVCNHQIELWAFRTFYARLLFEYHLVKRFAYTFVELLLTKSILYYRHLRYLPSKLYLALTQNYSHSAHSSIWTHFGAQLQLSIAVDPKAGSCDNLRLFVALWVVQTLDASLKKLGFEQSSFGLRGILVQRQEFQVIFKVC